MEKKHMITFNKPFLTGQEFEFIQDAVNSKKISGNGKYTKLCHEYFEKKYGFKKKTTFGIYKNSSKHSL